MIFFLMSKKTAGEERFRSIPRSAYRGAKGILLTFDVTNEESFKNLRFWSKEIDEHADANPNIILIGNKCDLVDQRIIDTERGQQLANEFCIQYFETSAKENVNVEEAFFCIAGEILKRGNESDSMQDVFETKKETMTTDLKEANWSGCSC